MNGVRHLSDVVRAGHDAEQEALRQREDGEEDEVHGRGAAHLRAARHREKAHDQHHQSYPSGNMRGFSF